MRLRKRNTRPNETETALPELERLLVAAAAAQSDRTEVAAVPGKGSVKRPRRRLARLGAPRLAALSFVLVLFGGTAMAATGIWDPPIGVLTGEPPPRTTESPIPAEITDLLGILRREQTPRDRSAEVETTLSKALFADGIRPESVRYLAPSGAEGEAAVLFSAEVPIRPYEPPERLCLYRPSFGFSTRELPFCFSRAKLLAGGAYLGFTTSSRKYLEAFRSRNEAVLAECEEPPLPAFCLPAAGTTVGIVPDGVATVTAHFSGAPAVIVPVHENYFELELHGAELTHIPIGVRYVVWRDADGNVIPQLRPEG